LAAASLVALSTLGASELPREAGPLLFNSFKGEKVS
jgi:hypothetical protein